MLIGFDVKDSLSLDRLIIHRTLSLSKGLSLFYKICRFSFVSCQLAQHYTESARKNKLIVKFIGKNIIIILKLFCKYLMSICKKSKNKAQFLSSFND